MVQPYWPRMETEDRKDSPRLDHSMACRLSKLAVNNYSAIDTLMAEGNKVRTTVIRHDNA